MHWLSFIICTAAIWWGLICKYQSRFELPVRLDGDGIPKLSSCMTLSSALTTTLLFVVITLNVLKFVSLKNLIFAIVEIALSTAVAVVLFNVPHIFLTPYGVRSRPPKLT